MLTRRGFTGLGGASALAASLPATASQSSASAPRRREVADLRAFAERSHPRGLEAAANQVWQARWNALARDADALSDGAYFIALRRGLGWFGDGHTTPLPFEFTGGVPDALKAGDFGLSLPIAINLFHDGAFITKASASHRNLLGKRIDRIGNVPTAEIIRANVLSWPGNMAWAHRWSGDSLTSPALLQGLGAVPSAAQPITLSIGGRSVTFVPAQARAELHDAARPTTAVERWNGEAGRGLFVRPLPERQAIYLSIDDMADADGYSFEKFTRDAFAALAGDSLSRVIVDLRRNGGGNNFFGEALRKRLASSRFNRPGGLYVLVGPKTFSAAQNLATRLERETFAIFVGEPTGGAPNHYGDAKTFSGAATGITSIVSTMPWFDSYPQDERPWIMPDVLVPGTFATWSSGADPALEAALIHRSEPADELSRERIFYYARESQKQEWKPFWM